MHKYVALYRTPEDAEQFDANYFGTHVPLANAVPGLVRAEVAKVRRMVAGEPMYHLMAELYFTSYEAMKVAFKTPEWAASGENLQSWGGLELVTMFVAEVLDDEGLDDEGLGDDGRPMPAGGTQDAPPG